MGARCVVGRSGCPDVPLPPSLRCFSVIRCIGRGAFGKVFENIKKNKRIIKGLYCPTADEQEILRHEIHEQEALRRQGLLPL